MSALCTARVTSSQSIWVENLHLGQRGPSAAVIRSIVDGAHPGVEERRAVRAHVGLQGGGEAAGEARHRHSGRPSSR
eukprot:5011346-Pyramimonas_sp.AAC.1